MHVVVMITTKDADQAKLISQTLINEKLVACCNIIPNVQSLFLWEGKIDNVNEVLVMLKTTKKVFSKIVKRVQQLHSYQVPEIIALPIIDGNKEYLQWVSQAVQQHKER